MEWVVALVPAVVLSVKSNNQLIKHAPLIFVLLPLMVLALLISIVVPYSLNHEYQVLNDVDLPVVTLIYRSDFYQLFAVGTGLSLIVLLACAAILNSDHILAIGVTAMLLAITHLIFSLISLVLPTIHIF